MDSLARTLIITHWLRILLTKWISYSKGALKTIPEMDRVAMLKQIILAEKKTRTERALGLLWDLQSDEIGVMVQPTEKPETKRGILSMDSFIL